MRAFFADWAGRGRRFCVWHAPQQLARGLVVQVHAFAEEANKCRRMTAVQARELAGAGFAVLRFDLLGCGDSDGDFADATWDDWVADVLQALEQARQCWRAAWPAQPLPPRPVLWSQRAGSLLAAAAAARQPQPLDFAFWQPATSGEPVLQQFLRLKLAAGLAGTAAKASSDDVRAELSAGRVVEIAGYALAPALAQGLGAARLLPPDAAATGAAAVHWLEVAAREPPALLPAGAATLERWRAAGHHVQAQAIRGPSFWATVEVEEAPALIAATLAALAGPPR